MKKLATICLILLLLMSASHGAKQKRVVKMVNLTLTSPAFGHNEKVPVRFTCDGDKVSPPLTITNVPAKARSLALTMIDPDARIGTFIHWLVWNISPQTKEFKEDVLPIGAIDGQNSTGQSGYIPPCPPSGSHRYIFTLYALDNELNLKPGSDRVALEQAMKGHVIAQAELIGKYR